MSVNFNESAEFKCEVSEAEAKGKWFKDGKEVVASDRIEVIERGCLRKLVINDVTASDQGIYTVYNIPTKLRFKTDAFKSVCD